MTGLAPSTPTRTVHVRSHERKFPCSHAYVETHHDLMNDDAMDRIMKHALEKSMVPFGYRKED